MSGQKKGGGDGRAAGGGGYTKRGKPRPGTGGYRRDRLEGKGPTPPASARPGHPAQRAAAAAAKADARTAGQPDGAMNGPESAGTVQNTRERTRQHAAAAKDRKWSPAGTRWWSHCGPGSRRWRCTSPGRAHEDERVAESVQLAAEAGIAVLESSVVELDRLTGGAIHQGVALRVRPYEYAHPEDLASEGPRGRSRSSLPLTA